MKRPRGCEGPPPTPGKEHVAFTEAWDSLKPWLRAAAELAGPYAVFSAPSAPYSVAQMEAWATWRKKQLRAEAVSALQGRSVGPEAPGPSDPHSGSASNLPLEDLPKDLARMAADTIRLLGARMREGVARELDAALAGGHRTGDPSADGPAARADDSPWSVLPEHLRQLLLRRHGPPALARRVADYAEPPESELDLAVVARSLQPLRALLDKLEVWRALRSASLSELAGVATAASCDESLGAPSTPGAHDEASGGMHAPRAQDEARKTAAPRTCVRERALRVKPRVLAHSAGGGGARLAEQWRLELTVENVGVEARRIGSITLMEDVRTVWGDALEALPREAQRLVDELVTWTVPLDPPVTLDRAGSYLTVLQTFDKGAHETGVLDVPVFCVLSLDGA